MAALLAGLFLWLPYTSVLLLFQFLRRGTSFKCLQWVIKLIPFFDTYFSPLKTRHWYWIGLLLLVRGALFITLTLTYASTPSAGLLAILIAITLLLVILAYTGRVYRNRLLSVLEYSFFVNLQVLTASFFFADLTEGSSKVIIVCISSGVAFAQFIGIVINHTWQIVSRKLAKKYTFFNWNRAIVQKNDEIDAYHLIVNKQLNDHVLRTIDVESFVEDHAVNADEVTAATSK